MPAKLHSPEQKGKMQLPRMFVVLIQPKNISTVQLLLFLLKGIELVE